MVLLLLFIRFQLNWTDLISWSQCFILLYRTISRFLSGFYHYVVHSSYGVLLEPMELPSVVVFIIFYSTFSKCSPNDWRFLHRWTTNRPTGIAVLTTCSSFLLKPKPRTTSSWTPSTKAVRVRNATHFFKKSTRVEFIPNYSYHSLSIQDKNWNHFG